MFVTKKALDRRLFLRSVGAALALPLLDAMTPAFAAPRKAVPRMGFMYTPNGANMSQWAPVSSGKEFSFSPTLKSLEPFRERVNVLSGLALHSADRMNDGAGDHSRATGAFLSGCHAKRTQGADLELGVTADQIAARVIGKTACCPLSNWESTITLPRRSATKVTPAHTAIPFPGPLPILRCRRRTTPGSCSSVSSARAAIRRPHRPAAPESQHS